MEKNDRETRKKIPLFPFFASRKKDSLVLNSACYLEQKRYGMVLA